MKAALSFAILLNIILALILIMRPIPVQWEQLPPEIIIRDSIQEVLLVQERLDTIWLASPERWDTLWIVVDNEIIPDTAAILKDWSMRREYRDTVPGTETNFRAEVWKNRLVALEWEVYPHLTQPPKKNYLGLSIGRHPTVDIGREVWRDWQVGVRIGVEPQNLMTSPQISIGRRF